MTPETKKLFISYRSDDAPKVDTIARNLALLKYENGRSCFETWQDKHDLPPASPNWWDAIVDAIIECDVFVFHISLGSLQSEVCKAELDYAYKRNRLIIPVVLKGEYILRPNSVKYDLEKKHWDLMPDWLKETQLLFYTGADFYKDLLQIIEKNEAKWPRDIDVRRPRDPDTNNEQLRNHSIYAVACDYAERLAFVEASEHFRTLLRRNDKDYADIAGEWISLLDFYYDLIEMDEQNSPRNIFNARLKDYLSLFPKSFLGDKIFDPKGFSQNYFEEAADNNRLWMAIPVVLVLIAIVAGLIWMSSNAARGDENQDNGTQVLNGAPSTEIVVGIDDTNTPTETASPEPTQTPPETLTPTATANATQQAQIVTGLQRLIIMEETQDTANTETAEAVTATAASWTPTYTPDLRATAEALNTLDARATSDARVPQFLDFEEGQQTVNVLDPSVVTNVTMSIEFLKTDGTCLSPAQSFAFHREITFRLTSPAGTVVNLVSEDTYTGGDNVGIVRVIFDDDAPTIVGGVPASGTFQPVELLSSFNGEVATGLWTLNTKDTVGLDPLCVLEWTLNVEVVEMIFVPPGCFLMGNDSEAFQGDADGGDQCFSEPFWIDTYEVSNAQFVEFLNARGNQSADGDQYFDTDDEDRKIRNFDGILWIVDFGLEHHPVIDVSWFGASDYCIWRGGTLPTEAEWEYSARGVDSLLYPWGNEFIADNVTIEENSGGQTAPVDSRPDGVSWVGAYNMIGNVWEWTASPFNDYPFDVENEDLSNRTGVRVLRGGSWNVNGTVNLRSASRGRFFPTDTDDDIGFRCIRS